MEKKLIGLYLMIIAIIFCTIMGFVYGFNTWVFVSNTEIVLTSVLGLMFIVATILMFFTEDKKDLNDPYDISGMD
jgi:low affinity Fe/Cu permease